MVGPTKAASLGALIINLGGKFIAAVEENDKWFTLHAGEWQNLTYFILNLHSEALFMHLATLRLKHNNN
jgi:hypothetical protein